MLAECVPGLEGSNELKINTTSTDNALKSLAITVINELHEHN